MSERIVLLNNQVGRLESTDTLYDFLLEHMQSRRHVRVHWGGTSEDALLLKSGKIKALGRKGGFEWNEDTYYDNFDQWFEKSVLLGDGQNWIILTGNFKEN